MKIYSVTDPEFKPYGKVLEGYDTAALQAAMAEIELPPQGVDYRASIKTLEACQAFYAGMRDRFYGGMPIEIGMCWGRNTKLNCMEYHRDSEINIGADDYVLLVARMDEVVDGVLDTSLVKAFRAPAGVPVEVYATTLHYAPCSATPTGSFRVAIVLPWGTNFDMPAFEPGCAEDTWMTARNKWLLAHPDTQEAKNGAHIGLRGVNIDIADSL